MGPTNGNVSESKELPKKESAKQDPVPPTGNETLGTIGPDGLHFFGTGNEILGTNPSVPTGMGNETLGTSKVDGAASGFLFPAAISTGTSEVAASGFNFPASTSTETETLVAATRASAFCSIPPSASTGVGFHFASLTTNAENDMNPPVEDNSNELEENNMNPPVEDNSNELEEESTNSDVVGNDNEESKDEGERPALPCRRSARTNLGQRACFYGYDE